MTTATERPTAPGTEEEAQAPPANNVARQALGVAMAQGFRFRRQLVPWAAMAGVGAVGLGAQPFDPTLVGWGAAVLAVGSWPVSGWLTDVMARRFHFTAVVASAGSWVAAAAANGLGPPLPAWLVGGGSLLALPWWYRYRHRGVAPAPTPAEIEAEKTVDRVTERASLWEDKVACKGGPLTDSMLIDSGDLLGGWAGLIEMTKGSNDRAVRALKEIGAALKLRLADITIEPIPTGELHLARIVVLPDNPLSNVVQWSGSTPDVETGVDEVGSYADGGRVRYQHFKPNSGPVHTLIAGTTDSGKSTTVGRLLLGERRSGMIVSMVIDPQLGQSLPEWQDVVHTYARGIDEARTLLLKARNRMYARNDQLSKVKWKDELGRIQTGLGSFNSMDPRHRGLDGKFPLLPMLSITIDECHIVLADKVCRDLVVEMIGLSRKCGVKFRLITQVPLMGSLGNSQEIASAVKSGNVIIHRTGERLSAMHAFNGTLPVDPCSLPKLWPDGSTTAGLGFASTPGTSRLAPMRIENVPDMFGAARVGSPPELEPDDDDEVVQEQKTAPAGDDPGQTKVGEDAVMTYLANHLDEDSPRGDIIAWARADIDPPPAVRTLVKALTDLTNAGRIVRSGHGSYRMSEFEARRCRKLLREMAEDPTE